MQDIIIGSDIPLSPMTRDKMLGNQMTSVLKSLKW